MLYWWGALVEENGGGQMGSHSGPFPEDSRILMIFPVILFIV